MLALAPVSGVTLSAATDGEILKAAKGGTHGFFPDFKEIQTGFIGNRAGFKTKITLPLMGLEDIAPIVCQLLGVSFNSTITSSPILFRAVVK